MAFLEDPRFPENISYGSQGGPRYNTIVTAVNSGYEYSNINWDQARHQYDASMGIRTMSELYDLIQFFHIARGKGHYFRYKDWGDYKSCPVDDTPTKDDQLFGVGDNSTTEFQLVKTYDLGGTITNQRTISKPVGVDENDTTILIALNTVLQTEGSGSDYTIDYSTGIVTFNSAPGSSVNITWGGEFDVPCRFDTDELALNLDFYLHGSTSVPIKEVRV